jgi:hypothetical protein
MYKIETYKSTQGRTLWRIVKMEGSKKVVVQQGITTSTNADIALRKLNEAAPAPTKTAPTSADSSARKAFYRGATDAVREKARQDQITNDAWALLKGDWPHDVIASREIVDRAAELKRFVDGINGASDGAVDGVPEDDWAATLAALLSPGGGPSGPSGGGAPAENPVDTPEEIDAFVRGNYGYLAGYLNDREIGPILKQAAREGWDKARLQGALSNTGWWKNTSESAREWDALWQMDQATAKSQVDERLAVIKRQASLLGLQITGEVDLGGFGKYQRDYYLAVASLREGWSPEQLAERIFNEAGFNPENQYKQGQIAAQADAVKAMAADYFLSVGDKSANQWAKQLLMGELDQDGLEALFREQAKGRYGSLAELIDKGTKPAQFFDSYKQQIAQMLEIDADTIDLMSPKWLPIVETVGTDGARRPMTLAETADYVRKTPEYDKTDGAMALASRVGELLGSTFGKVG